VKLKVSVTPAAMVVGLPGSGFTVYSEVRSAPPMKVKFTAPTVISARPTFSMVTETG